MRRGLTIAIAAVTAFVTAFAASAALAAFLLARWADGTLGLAPLVGDGMVLQRDTTVAITGHARPGWPVVVAGSWKAVALTRADAAGGWRADLRTGEAGGPHRVLVWAGEARVVEDVWLGEAWLCSGQSNMSMTVAEADATALDAIPQKHPIHLFTVPLAMSDVPQGTCDGAWQPAVPDTIRSFSAVCLAFGRTLQGILRVPIGLVLAAAPGTPIELWTSERGLREVPEIAAEIDEARAELAGKPPPQPVERPWRPLAELPTIEPDNNAIFDSVLSLRTDATVTPDLAGGVVVLDLPPALAHATVLANERVLEPAATENRVVPADLLTEPTIAVRIEHRLVTPLTAAELGVPHLRVGARVIALPPWQAKIDRPRFASRFHQQHSLLFNAMIAPLVPYTLQGAVWYQGEANVVRAAQYGQTFPAMIRDWRTWWDRELAFGFVQLPPFGGYRPRGAIAELREAQRRTLAVPGTGMVVTMDLGDPKDIHSAPKPMIGGRLGAWALAEVYQQPGIVATGPLFREMRVEPWGVRVTFDHTADGLTAVQKHPVGFEVAGADGHYRPTTGILDKDSVILRVPGIAAPVAVRYAWSDVPAVSLKNSAGLPASPFRSDDWKGVTSGNGWHARPKRRQPPAPPSEQQPGTQPPSQEPAQPPAPSLQQPAPPQPPPAPPSQPPPS